MKKFCCCCRREAVSDVALCLVHLDVSDDDENDNDSSISQSPDQASQEMAEAICQAAIEHADPVQLKELLKAVDDTRAAEISNTLALLAAQRGHANIIPVLADEGADFNSCDRYRGGPPLMHAANNGHANTVKALLEVHIMLVAQITSYSAKELFSTAPALGQAEVVCTEQHMTEDFCHCCCRQVQM